MFWEGQKKLKTSLLVLTLLLTKLRRRILQILWNTIFDELLNSEHLSWGNWIEPWNNTKFETSYIVICPLCHLKKKVPGLKLTPRVPFAQLHEKCTFTAWKLIYSIFIKKMCSGSSQDYKCSPITQRCVFPVSYPVYLLLWQQ